MTTDTLTQAAREARDALASVITTLDNIGETPGPHSECATWARVDWAREALGPMEAALARLDAALASGDAEPVAIKPLEWKPHHAAGKPRCPAEFANTSFGVSYVVSAEGWWMPLEALRPCTGIEAAKASAQADYESRIRSCLAAAPAKEPKP